MIATIFAHQAHVFVFFCSFISRGDLIELCVIDVNISNAASNASPLFSVRFIWHPIRHTRKKMLTLLTHAQTVFRFHSLAEERIRSLDSDLIYVHFNLFVYQTTRIDANKKFISFWQWFCVTSRQKHFIIVKVKGANNFYTAQGNFSPEKRYDIISIFIQRNHIDLAC